MQTLDISLSLQSRYEMSVRIFVLPHGMNYHPFALELVTFNCLLGAYALNVYHFYKEYKGHIVEVRGAVWYS